MRKAALLFLLTAILLLSSCRPQSVIPNTSASPDDFPAISDNQSGDSEPAESGDKSGDSDNDSQPGTSIDYNTDPLNYLSQNMPTIDGSTSLIPLEGGIKAAIFGVSQSEAEKMVYHTSTYGSYYNLLDSKCDMIFSVPLSEEQYSQAEERGITLEEVPIAMEGFVFVVNYDNPVDTLTQKQLRDIYSGDITNWKEVGGRDEEIIAYQRNWTSGSQNYMITFMGDTPLIDAPTEMRPASMVGLMDVIAVNENAENSIGYSVYAYAADMYGTGKDVKFIKVDGVEPNKQTMASGEYPLLSYNYAIFNAEEPEDSPVRRLTEWMTSYDGQLAIANAGYVSVEDIGFDYDEMKLKLWSGMGKGAPRLVDFSVPTSEYMPFHGGDSHLHWNTFEKYKVPIVEIKPENASGLTKGVRFELDCLTNKKTQNEINRWISEVMSGADEKADEFAYYIERLNGDTSGEWFFYSEIGDQYSTIRPEDYHPSASCVATARNGYLSVTVAMTYSLAVQDGYQRYYDIETGVWDLLTGKMLEIDELFYSGVDIDEVLNDYLRRVSQEPIDSYGTYHSMKKDFAGLTTTGWKMTADTIYIEQDNPYFAYGVGFDLKINDGYLVCEQPRDMSDCFESGKVKVKQFFRTTDKNKVYEYVCDGFITCEFLDEDSYPTAGKIKSRLVALLEEHFSRDKVIEYFVKQGVPEEHINIFDHSWSMKEYVGKFVKYSKWLDSVYFDGEQYEYPYFTQPIFFDLQTGDYLDWRTLVDEDWLAEQKSDTDKLEGMVLIDVGLNSAYVVLTFQESGNANGQTVNLHVPPEYINW